MSLSVTVPPEYGYVLLTAVSTSFIGFFHTYLTSKYRKLSKTPYPNAYCSREEVDANKDKYLFNCAQRAHANYLEHQPAFLVGLLASGIRYPLVASALGVWWGAFRVVYALGYVRRDRENGKGRSAGTAFYIGEIGLTGLAIWTGLRLLSGA